MAESKSSRIAELEKKLDESLWKLRSSNDPVIRRDLLTDMRKLIAELDRLIVES